MMLHVAGRLTESVASFVGPGLDYLRGEGVRQRLLWLDDGGSPRALSSIPDGVELCRVDARQGGLAPWRSLQAAYRRMAMAPGEVSAVHFHGVRPWLIGLRESHRWTRPPVVYVSPHGSRLLGLLPMGLAMARRRGMSAPGADAREGAGGRSTIIATSEFEAERVRSLGLPVSSAPCVVDEAYFELVRSELPYPSVVAGSYLMSRSGAERLVRLAVILANAAPRMDFRWLGLCTPDMLSRLDAVGAQHVAPDDACQVLESLRGAWVFIATEPDPRMPLILAQALACGVPCVAINTPVHAALIDHGRNGLLVSGEAELQAAVSRLMDHPELRRELGAAARVDAGGRFSRGRFASDMELVYGGAPWSGSDTVSVAGSEPAGFAPQRP